MGIFTEFVTAAPQLATDVSYLAQVFEGDQNNDQKLVDDFDQGAVQPPGDTALLVQRLLGWMKWGGLVAGVVGLIICGIMMIIGRRSRSQTAVEGAAGIPWVLAGLTLISLAASLVGSIGVS